MDDLWKVLQPIFAAVAKSKLIVLAIVVLGVGAIIWKNFGFIEGMSLNLHLKEQVDTSPHSKPPAGPSYQPTLEIVDVRTSPTRFERLNYLLFRVHNSGHADALDLLVTVDLGRGRVLDKEIRQAPFCRFDVSESTSIVFVRCNKLPLSGYLDVNLQLSEPHFVQIEAHAANQVFPTVHIFNGTESSLLARFSGFVTFLQILAGFALFFIVGGVVVKILNWMFPGQEERPPN